MRLSLFDWNGNLDAEVKEDEAKFGIKATPIGNRCMGHQEFEIEGDAEAIARFMEFYGLDADDDGVDVDDPLGDWHGRNL
jgi:hypothetical protein